MNVPRTHSLLTAPSSSRAANRSSINCATRHATPSMPSKSSSPPIAVSISPVVPSTCALTTETAPDAISVFPDLQYAIFMPWVDARSWSGLMQNKAASAAYRPANARTLALQTARVLRYLEAHHLAHTDIAGSNIFLAPGLNQVQLLDLEGMYYEGAIPPALPSRGSPGYRHPRLPGNGQYCLAGDRFAGAILLTEMLTWCDPVVRALIADQSESLFQPQQLQTIDNPLWQAVRTSLSAIDASLLALFDQAWASSQLSDCPEFTRWNQHLERIAAAPITR